MPPGTGFGGRGTTASGPMRKGPRNCVTARGPRKASAGLLLHGNRDRSDLPAFVPNGERHGFAGGRVFGDLNVELPNTPQPRRQAAEPDHRRNAAHPNIRNRSGKQRRAGSGRSEADGGRVPFPYEESGGRPEQLHDRAAAGGSDPVNASILVQAGHEAGFVAGINPQPERRVSGGMVRAGEMVTVPRISAGMPKGMRGVAMRRGERVAVNVSGASASPAAKPPARRGGDQRCRNTDRTPAAGNHQRVPRVAAPVVDYRPLVSGKVLYETL